MKLTGGTPRGWILPSESPKEGEGSKSGATQPTLKAIPDRVRKKKKVKAPGPKRRSPVAYEGLESDLEDALVMKGVRPLSRPLD